MTRLAAGAWFGVTLFFVLSGAVLTWSWKSRLVPRRWPVVWSFAVARFARVYPMYLAGLLLVLAVRILENVQIGSDVWWHVFALQSWHPDVFVAFGYDGPEWSIGVEFFLYATFPLLIPLVSKLKGRQAPVLGVLAVAIPIALACVALLTGLAQLPETDPLSAHRWLFRTPLFRLPDFLVGMAIALVVSDVRMQRFRLGALLQAVGGLGIVALLLISPIIPTVFHYDGMWLPFVALLIAGLVLAGKTWFAQLLSSSPIVLLGESSYAFYILHAPLIAMVGLWSYGTSPSRFALSVAIELVVIVAAAVGAHFGLERPAQRGLRRLLDPRLRGSERRRPDGAPTIGA